MHTDGFTLEIFLKNIWFEIVKFDQSKFIAITYVDLSPIASFLQCDRGQ